MIQKTYTLSGMHCSSCANKLTQALSPFAERVEVSLSSGSVVTHDETVELERLQSAVASAGKYELLATP